MARLRRRGPRDERVDQHAPDGNDDHCRRCCGCSGRAGGVDDIALNFTSGRGCHRDPDSDRIVQSFDESVFQYGFEEGAGSVLRRGVEDLLRWAFFDDLACVEDQHPVGDVTGEPHFVCDDEHGDVGGGGNGA